MTNPRLSLATALSTALFITNQNPLAFAASNAYNQCPAVESLKCRNGSTCVEGVANFGKHGVLDLQTHEEGWHCQCLPGFTGHECEIEVADCNGEHFEHKGSKLHSCYHGSACETKMTPAGDLAGIYCNCDSVNDKSAPTAAKFAGLMCEHEATSLCAVSLVEFSAPRKQFCTNHGKCVKMVTEGAAHPGCVCRKGWTGDHCELQQDLLELSVDPLQDIEGGGNKTAGTVMFSILVSAIGLVVIAIGMAVYKMRKGPSERAIGKTAAEVGAGELEADGSGTMGSSNVEDSAEEGSGLEMGTKNDTSPAAEAADEGADEATAAGETTVGEII